MGTIIVEITGVESPHGVASPKSLTIHEDVYIGGHNELVEAAHAHGARIMVQLAHVGRNRRFAMGVQPVAPSPIPNRFFGVTPRELSRGEIEDLVKKFIAAALRARTAGYDGIELHGAHGYLIGEFMSPLSNRRKDRYGGNHLQEVGDSIHHVAFSPDGTYIVTASDDGTVRVWDANVGKLHVELKSRRGALRWAEFDPTSKLVVSAGGDSVAISDVATGMPVSVLEGPRGLVLSAHFDSTAHRVVAPSWDGTARVWNATSAYRQWNSPPLGEDCNSDASLDADQRFIAIRCDKGSHVWDTAAQKRIGDLPTVTQPRGEFQPAFPAVSAAGDLAAIARGTDVEIYTLPEGRLVRTITHHAEISAVAFARTGHDLISASVGGALLLWRNDREPFELPGFSDGIDAIGFTPDGRVVAASRKGQLRVYDPDRPQILAELTLPAGHRVRSFRVSADSHRLLTIAYTGSPSPPVLWDLEHYQMISPLKGDKGQVFSARFVRGDREILTASNDGTARLWDGMTGHPRQSYSGGALPLFDAALDPDGSTLVTAGRDGVLRFWDVKAGRMIWTLSAHRLSIAGVHFEGADIVTRSLEGEVSRWRLAKSSSSQGFAGMIERYIRCLPQHFDEKTGELVGQETSCDISADRAP